MRSSFGMLKAEIRRSYHHKNCNSLLGSHGQCAVRHTWDALKHTRLRRHDMPALLLNRGLDQYLAPPEATGTLLADLYSYDVRCKATRLAQLNFPWPEQSRWRVFSTAAPSGLPPPRILVLRQRSILVVISAQLRVALVRRSLAVPLVRRQVVGTGPEFA
jgi:hypothetical protein